MIKMATRVVTIGLAIFAFSIVCKIGIKKYKTHIPVEPTGTCIVFDLSEDTNSPMITAGAVVESDFKEGVTVIVVAPAGFPIPVTVPNISLREKGYIKVNCNAV